MSLYRHPHGAMLLRDLPIPAGTWFPWHVHDQHQLVWASQGVAAVDAGSAHWVLPPTRALWMPAGIEHRTGTHGRAVLHGIWADPARCPIAWPSPRLVAVRPLLRELLSHLSTDALTAGERLRAELVVFDVLEPVPVAPITVPLPSGPRVLAVAEALLADPADPRDLAAHGRVVGASDRTLARLFLAECGVTFGRWRTPARLRAALPLLASALPLEGVARRVGYSSASAFVAAFHREVGVTPAEYFRS